ncbi:uncharacterized protein LOC143230461 [Tachypleus tridentatus]|uniref:uncharacterized protein LOC143230461 n=1 Tax=Tachypleus tridentatus TaxID=6853 RepID=UPI003FD55F89
MASNSFPQECTLRITNVIHEQGKLLKFWAQFDLKAMQEITDILTQYHQLLKDAPGFLHQCQLPLGSLCCARSFRDGKWYRAKVVALPSNNGSVVAVQYIDYGNVDVVSVGDVRQIEEKHFPYHPQAVECFLADVVPSESDGVWNQTSIVFFEEQMLMKEVVGIILGRLGESVVVRLPIACILVANGFAIPHSNYRSGGDGLRAMPFDVTKQHQVYVSHVESTQKFYIQLVEKKSDLNSLMDALNELVASRNGLKPLYQFSLGTPCIARSDESYYRGVVCGVTGVKCKVFFVDFGNSETIRFPELFQLPWEFMTLPAQAIECSLGSDCTINTTELVESTCNKQVLCSVVHHDNGSYIVTLCVNGRNIAVPVTSIRPNCLKYNRTSLMGETAHEVRVSYIQSPSNFYCQLAQETSKIEAVVAEIASVYKGADNLSHHLLAEECWIGRPVCACFSEDSEWYRGEIMSVFQDNKVKVWFIDYGNSEVTDLENVKCLKPVLQNMPAQAIQCSLFGTEALNRSTLECQKVVEFFEELTLDNVGVIKVKNITNNGIHEVLMYNMTTNPPVDINEKIIMFVSSLNQVTVPVSPVEEIETVYISHFESPTHFFGQLSKYSLKELEQFQEQLNYFYSSGSPETLPNPKVGDFACTVFSEDGHFYRGKLKSVSGASCEVLFIDYGNGEQKDIKSLYKLLPKFSVLPQQGLYFSLVNCPPRAPSDKLRDLMQDNVLQVRVLQKREEVYEVELMEDFSGNVTILEIMRQHEGPSLQKPVPSSIRGFKLPKVEIGSNHVVMVTEVTSPNSFYCQLQNAGKQLETLAVDLEMFYGSLVPKDEVLTNPREDTPCVAQFSEDGAWYRALVTKVLPSGEYEVLFVDYGNSECCHQDVVKCIKPQFLNLPKQAVWCTLAGVPHMVWSSVNRENFETMVLGKTLSALFKGTGPGECQYQVELIDGSNNKINTILQATIKGKTSFQSSPSKASPKRFLGLEKDACEKNSPDGFQSVANSFTRLTRDISKWGNNPQRNVYKGKQFGKVTSPGSSSIENEPISRKDFGRKEAGVQHFSHTSDKSQWRDRPSKFAKADFNRPRISSGDSRSSDESSGSSKRNIKHPERFFIDEFQSSKHSVLNQNQDFVSRSKNQSSSLQRENFADKVSTNFKELVIPDKAFRDVTVVYAISPSEFYCQLTEHASELVEVMKKLDVTYSELNDSSLSLINPHVGSPCAVFYSAGGTWYRGKVVSLLDTFIEVQFVDYGNSEKVSSNKVKILKSEFFYLPIQAIKCSLYNTLPLESSWTTDDVNKFSEMTKEKSLVGQFVHKQVNGSFLVNLIDMDKLENDILNKDFVESGHGKTLGMKTPIIRSLSSAIADVEIADPSVRVGEKEVVQVTWVMNLREFYLQLQSSCQQFNSLMCEIQAFYSTSTSAATPVDHPKINQVCAARFTEDDAWYRARILYVKDGMVGVLYVDYGNGQEIPLDRIKYLLPDFAALLPSQAVKCYLKGVKPPNGNLPSIDESTYNSFFAGNMECTFIEKVDSGFLVDMERNGKNLAEEFILNNLAERETLLIPEQSKFEMRTYLQSPRFEHKIVKLNQILEVVVSFVENPQSFWCQLKQTIPQLESLMEQINSYYSSLSDDQDILSASEKFCVAKFSRDESWYRAFIQEHVSSEIIRVYCLDYGNSEEVKFSKCKRLHDKFKGLSAQAIKCRLYGMPSQSTEQQSKDFVNIIDEKEIMIKVCKKKPSILAVNVLDNSSGTEVDVGKTIFGTTKYEEPLKINGQPEIPEGEQKGYLIIDSLYKSDFEFFHVQLDSAKSQINDMSSRIKTSELLLPHEVEIGENYCVRENDIWYRVKVYHNNGTVISAKMIDCGKYSSFDANIFYELPEDLEAFPPLAIPCKLFGIEWKRSNKKLVEKCLAGSDLLSEKEFTIKFINNWKHSALVSVMDGAVDISQSLITEGLAVAMSKENEAIITAGCNLTTLNDDPLLISVIHFESLDKFYVIPVKELENLDILSAKLQNMFETMDEEEGRLTEPYWGKACICKFSEDGVWYRGVITSLNNEIVTVCFVDFGNVEETTIDQLKEYPKDSLNSKDSEPDCFNFPALAVCCSLYGTTAVEGKEKEIEDFFGELDEEYLTLEICERGSPYNVVLSLNGIEIGENMCKKELVNLNRPIVKYAEGSRSLSEHRYSVISHFESLSCIFLVPNSYEYESFQKKLQTVYNQIKLDELELDNVAKGVPCVVKTTVDNCWYRGIITDVKMETVTVFFIDLGITEIKVSKELKKLKVSFSWQLPFSLKCSVSHDLACAEFDLKLFYKSGNIEAVRKEVIGKMVQVEFMSSEPIPAVKLFAARDMSKNQDCHQMIDLIEVLKSKFLLSSKKIEQEKEQGYSPLTTPHQQKYPLLDIPLHTKLEVMVSYVNTPSEFWVQLLCQQEQLHNIMDEIADIYSYILEDEFVITEPQPGTPCVSVFSEDGGWYRGVIKEVMDGSVKVHFVDYGNCEEVPITFVKEINSDLLKTPQLAVKCSLYDIKPTSDSEWNIDQCEVFQELVDENKVFLGEFFSSIDSTYQIKLLNMGIDVGKTFFSKCIASISSVEEKRLEELSCDVNKENESCNMTGKDQEPSSVTDKEFDEPYSVTDEEKPNSDLNKECKSDSNVYQYGPTDVVLKNEICNIVEENFGNEAGDSVCTLEKDILEENINQKHFALSSEPNPLSENQIIPAVIPMEKLDTTAKTDYEIEPKLVSIQAKEILEDFTLLEENNETGFVLFSKDVNEENQRVLSDVDRNLSDHDTITVPSDDYLEFKSNMEAKSGEELEYCTHEEKESFKLWEEKNVPASTELDETILYTQVSFCSRISKEDKDVENEYEQELSTNRGQQSEHLIMASAEKPLTCNIQEEQPLLKKELDKKIVYSEQTAIGEESGKEIVCSEHTTPEGEELDKEIVYSEHTGKESDEEIVCSEHTGKESDEEIVCSEHTGKESDEEIVCSEHTGKESDEEIVCSEHTGKESDEEIVCSEHTGKELDEDIVCSEYTTLEGKESDKDIVCIEHTTLEGKESDNLKDIARDDNPEDYNDLGTTTNKPLEISTPHTHGETLFSTATEEEC